MVTEAGRDPRAVGLSLRVTVFGENAPAQASDGEHRLFAGPAALVAADIRALRDMGVGSLDFGFGGSTAHEVLACMQKLRAQVFPLVHLHLPSCSINVAQRSSFGKVVSAL